MNAKRQFIAFVAVALASAAAALGPRPAGGDAFTSQKDLLPPPQRLNDDPPAPLLSDAEKTYLVKLARRAMEHAAQTGKAFRPADVPESLKAKDYLAFVSARQVGHLIDSALGGGKTLAENVADAALFVATNKAFGTDRLKGVRDSVIEVEVLGPGQLLPFPRMDQIYEAVMPGVHALSARVADKTGVNTITLKASVAPVHGYSAPMVLQRLLEKAGWTVPQVVAHRQRVVFFRSRSAHLLEPPAGSGFVELFRCAQLIAVDQVSRQRIDELIDQIGRYMCYRQLDSGLFSYCYSPAEGYYQKGDNAVRQSGSAWSVARLARSTRNAGDELAAFKAIAAAKLRYLDAGRTVACAGYPFEPERESLGSTALLLAATVDCPENKPLAALRDKLAAGLVSQQQPDGSFKLFYYNNTDEGNKVYYPGEAVLALMKVHRQTGEKRWLDAVEKAFKFYHAMFQNEPNRGFAAWHAQAWALAYETTGKKEYLDFVLQLGDYLVGFQAGENAAVYPDLVGGFVGDDGSAGIGSAAFLEGVAAGHRLAAKAGDAKRTAKYARSLLLGARFIDQLTFKKPEAFYCLTPKDVIGGLKTSPVDHTVRIDHCQHALGALLGIRDELFPAPADKPK